MHVRLHLIAGLLAVASADAAAQARPADSVHAISHWATDVERDRGALTTTVLSVRSQTLERVWLNGDTVFRWQDSLGSVLHRREGLAEKGAEVRRDFSALIGSTHEGYKSNEAMPRVRCN